MCRDRSGEYVCDLEGEEDGGKDIGDLHVGWKIDYEVLGEKCREGIIRSV